MPTSYNLSASADSFGEAYEKLGEGAIALARTEDAAPELAETLDKAMDALELLADTVGDGPVTVSVQGQASDGRSGVADAGAADTIGITVTSMRYSEAWVKENGPQALPEHAAGAFADATVDRGRGRGE